MNITPLDIKKQEFSSSFRGFNKTDVITFLEMISEEMENLIRENLELKEKLQRASERLNNYTKIESALQSTLVATQESVEQMKNNAQEKAELIVREANAKADRIINESYDKLTALRQEYSSLKNQRAAFLVNLKSLLESQLRLLELVEKQTDPGGKTLIMRKKAELSEADVDRMVEEFRKDIEHTAEKTISVEKNIADTTKTQEEN